MICKQCGSSLRPGSSTCAKCGAKQESSLESGGFSNLAAQAREGSGGFSVPGDPGKPDSSRPASPRPAASRPTPVRSAPPARNGSTLSLVLLVGLVVCLILSIVSCSKSGRLEDTVADLQNQITQLQDDLSSLSEKSSQPNTAPVATIPTTGDTETQPDETLPGEKEAVSQRDITFMADLDGERCSCDDEAFQGAPASDDDGYKFVFVYTDPVEKGVDNEVELEISLDSDAVEIDYDLDQKLFGSRNGYIECCFYEAGTDNQVYSIPQIDDPEVVLKFRDLTEQVPYLRCEIIRRSGDGGQVALIIDNIPVPATR